MSMTRRDFVAQAALVAAAVPALAQGQPGQPGQEQFWRDIGDGEAMVDGFLRGVAGQRTAELELADRAAAESWLCSACCVQGLSR